ncbi:hypothetical protein FKM82_009065 [Ascaphus truei]
MFIHIPEVFVICALVLTFLLSDVSSAWEEDGNDDLHVVSYVYREMLVCVTKFTYIYAKRLSALYSLCLLSFIVYTIATY